MCDVVYALAVSSISLKSAKAAGASFCASRSMRKTASIRSIRTTAVRLDPALLARFPSGYRHLAYVQTQIGYAAVKTDMPGLRGAEVEALYRRGREWLKR